MSLLQELGVALGLGLLIGLQREWAAGEVAGIRTFPLIAVLGVLCGALGEAYGGWTVAAGLVALAAMLVVGNVVRLRGGDLDPGITTEMAALVTFLLGAGLALGYATEAVVLAGGVAVLLHLKEPLHRLADRIGADEFRAVIRLVLVGLVVLPVLPDRAYGPYAVLNPREIWLMVVLIVGISLAAYLVYRFLGGGRGSVAAGVLGGLISSTATTVSEARRSAVTAGTGGVAATVVTLAATVVFLRVLFEVAVVHPAMLRTAGPPVVILMGVMSCASGWGYLRDRGTFRDAPAEREAPSQLGTAIAFGVVYAVVLFAAAFAREEFGTGGLYVVSAVSGLTDVDAITLSTTQLVRAGRLSPSTGWRMIVIGAMANLAFKGVVVAVLARRRLLGRVAWRFASGLAAGGLLLWLWPG